MPIEGLPVQYEGADAVRSRSVTRRGRLLRLRRCRGDQKTFQTAIGPVRLLSQAALESCLCGSMTNLLATPASNDL
jgi:hypothetical protein